MGEELQSWKSVFRLGELLELAAARKQAQSHNRLYGNLTFSQSRVCIALIRLLEKQPEGVTLKQLSAELEIQLPAELGNAPADAFGLKLDILVVVKTDAGHGHLSVSRLLAGIIW